jgi:very-short-patch-repair endonuclease
VRAPQHAVDKARLSCAKARLAVEVDGIGHDMGDAQRDLRRSAWLKA